MSAASSRSQWPALVAGCLLLALTFGIYLYHEFHDSSCCRDLVVFLSGASILAHGQGANLYDVTTQGEVQKALIGPSTLSGGALVFNYPPYVGAIFIPLTWVSPQAAYYIWLVVGWVILFLFLLSVRSQYRKWHYTMPQTTAIAIVSFAPIIEAIIWRQMSLILVFLWWWAFVSWREARWGQLGVAVALSAFKPQIALLLVVGLIAQKRWKALLYTISVQAALWGLFVLVAGPGVISSYIGMLRLSAQSVNTFGFFPEAMPNLRGLLTLAGVGLDVSSLVSLAAWVLSLGAVGLVWRTSWSISICFGLTALLAVLFSPHLYFHDASLLILAFICAELAYAEQGVPFNIIRLLPVFYGLLAALFILVLSDWHLFTGAVLTVWLFGCVMFVVLLNAVYLNKSKSLRDFDLFRKRRAVDSL